MEAKTPRVRHVVADSGAFIRNAALKDIGELIYTLKDVVNEIRDKATRQRLQVLPYTLKLKEPSPDAIHTVTEFAKKTGDYPSLSAVDLRVIALVYQLEKEHVGADHIKTAPDQKATWNTTNRLIENPTKIAGFYLGKKNVTAPGTPDTHSECQTSENVGVPNASEEFTAGTAAAAAVSPDNPSTSPSPVDMETVSVDSGPESMDNNEQNLVKEKLPGELGEGDLLAEEALVDEEMSEEDEEDDDEDDEDADDGGWITPANVQKVKASLGGSDTEVANITVGCLTTDFAMQNVLLQMGLNVIAVDGMLIKRAKNYILRCFACFKLSTNMMKEFCHHCGNKTLQKVAMTVNADGSIQYFLSRRKQVSTRGLKYSLPKPQGGKHSSNPILCADQKEAHQRMARSSRVKYDAMSPDYEAHTSPFAPIDVCSRSAQLGVRDYKHAFRNKRNPNEKKKLYGRRK